MSGSGYRKKLRIRPALPVIFALSVFAFLYWSAGDFYFSKPAAPRASVQSLIESCRQKVRSTSARAECYDSVFAKRVENSSVVSLVREFGVAMAESPEIRRDCHQIAHAIGRTALAKMGNIADVFGLDREVDTCAGGVFHGAIEKMFRPDDDVPRDEHITLKEFEAKVPTLCDQFEIIDLVSECAHGIGHGVVYITANVQKSLEVCDTLSENADTFSCHSGVFMEYFVSGQSKKDNTKDLLFPCDVHKNPYRNPCHYVLAFRLAEFDLERDEIIKKCREAPSPAGSFCVRGYGIFYLAHDALADGYDAVVQFCESLDRKNSRVCAEAVASRLAAHSQNGEYAMPFCGMFNSSYLQGRCFSYTADVLRLGHKMDPAAIKNECRKYLDVSRLCIDSI